MEAASRLLAGGEAALHAGAGPPSSPPIAPALFRDAIERSLLPVFGVLVLIAAVNLFVSARFPGTRRKVDAAEITSASP